jgi:hypothetical protein
MKHYIHINQHVLKSNKKHGTNDPIITVKSYKDNRYGHEVVINGPCRIVYTPDKPLSCGATVYIVVEDGVEIEVKNENINFLSKICDLT